MKLKKFLAIMLALVMVLGLASITAFASQSGGDTIDNSIIELGENDPAEVAITKAVSTAIGTEIPYLTYTFNIVQDKVGTVKVNDGAPGNATQYTVVTTQWEGLDGKSVTIKPEAGDKLGSSNPEYSSEKDLYKKQSGNIFEGVTVPSTDAGVAIYRFTITESTNLVDNDAAWGGIQQTDPYTWITPSPATTTVGESNETLKLSKAEYEMLVYTKPKADNSGRYIFAITVRQTKYDDGSDAINEPKKNPTPGKNPYIDGDFSDLEFTNNYEKVEVTDPMNPNGQPYQLSKKVTGVDNDAGILTAADRQKFEFTVTLTLPEAVPAGAEDVVVKGRLWTSQDGATWAPQHSNAQGSANSIILEDPTKYTDPITNENIGHQDVVVFTIPAGQQSATQVVNLANNEKITFPTVTSGMKFDVVEKDYYDSNNISGTVGTPVKTYKLTPVVNGETKVDFATATDAQKLDARSDSQTVGSNPVASDYQNDGASGTTPTGIIMQYLPFFVIIALAVIALAASVVVKGSRRRRA